MSERSVTAWQTLKIIDNCQIKSDLTLFWRFSAVRHFGKRIQLTSCQSCVVWSYASCVHILIRKRTLVTCIPRRSRASPLQRCMSIELEVPISACWIVAGKNPSHLEEKFNVSQLYVTTAPTIRGNVVSDYTSRQTGHYCTVCVINCPPAPTKLTLFQCCSGPLPFGRLLVLTLIHMKPQEDSICTRFQSQLTCCMEIACYLQWLSYSSDRMRSKPPSN